MSSPLMSYEEAAALVAECARALRLDRPAVERVELVRAAGRVLAEPLIADRDQPPFPRSTRDGYACRASEASAHAWLPVAGSTRAGQAGAEPLPHGAAWEIMTGAPVPEGADAVAMLEHVELAEGKIRIAENRILEAGENIVAKGVEARGGDELIPSGAVLGSQQIALAASCGCAVVPVFARPRVAILTTGDELVRVESTPGPSQIRNSNAPMLAAMVSDAGGKPLILPTAADEPEALDDALSQAANADLLIVSGGVSAGKFDLVEDALARIGAHFHFTGARIQPGKPVVFGEVGRPQAQDVKSRVQPFFGLPGNPISSAVTFLLFVAPVLRSLAGQDDLRPQFAMAKLSRDCKGRSGLTRFVPSHCSFRWRPGLVPAVEPVHWQGSGDLTAFARSNCFLVVPEGTSSLAAGEIGTILLTGGRG